jgi:hypothetical protein
VGVVHRQAADEHAGALGQLADGNDGFGYALSLEGGNGIVLPNGLAITPSISARIYGRLVCLASALSSFRAVVRVSPTKPCRGFTSTSANDLGWLRNY